jgi:hypothetical protein
MSAFFSHDFFVFRFDNKKWVDRFNHETDVWILGADEVEELDHNLKYSSNLIEDVPNAEDGSGDGKLVFR